MNRLFHIIHILCLAAFLIAVPHTPANAKENNQEDFKFEANDVRLGDFDEMDKDHFIRFLVPYSKTFFYIDRAKQKGLSHDIIKLFEKALNKKLKKGHVKIKAVIIPTKRDKLIENLVQGYGDVAIGNLTITPERLKQVDFSDPIYKDAREVVITSKKAPKLKSLFDLSGKEVFVRKSSSYYESLVKVNQSLKEMKKAPVIIKKADEFLEDEDLLEMVNADLIPMVVVDLHKADLWAKIYSNIKVQDHIAIRTGGEIAWAFRKNSPILREKLNSFIAKNKIGTLHGNILANRYFDDTKYITNNTSEKALKQFDQTIEIIKKYATQYSFDWIMITALAYQESKLDNSQVSKAGAVGIMQVLPSTAADPNVGIKDIRSLQNNVHAGVKYLRFMVDRYYNDDTIDRLNRHLFAFASYNAGPARVAQLRKKAADKGLDPNVWFNNVELAAAQVIGRETVQYVSNIYKYYIAYKLVVEKERKKSKKLKELKKS